MNLLFQWTSVDNSDNVEFLRVIIVITSSLGVTNMANLNVVRDDGMNERRTARTNAL